MKIASNIWFSLVLLLLAGILLLPAGIASAAQHAQNHSHEQHPTPASTVQQSHSGHQHQHDSGAVVHDGHMALMAAFKKTVPEDYRIMERTPVIDSQESVFNGRKSYMLHCAVCHGSLGRGDGPQAAGMKVPPADFLDFEHSAHYGPGEKYWLIAKGSSSLGMPAHPTVTPKEIWNMVNYILALQAKVKSEGYDKPPHIH